MKAGFAEIDLTPRGPCAMAGYAARTGPSEGVLDPIKARVAVLNHDLAIVALDWCWVYDEFVRRLRRALGIKHVVVAATHTHSGPEPYDVTSKIVRAVREADRNARECEVRFGRAPVKGIGANRRHPAGPHDPEVRVLVFGRHAIVNYGCHPTTIGAANRKLSADFFGLAASEFPGVMIMTNGACADVSTRFTRRGEDYSETRRFAKIFSRAIRRAIASSRPVRAEPIDVFGRTLRLKARPPLPVSEARRILRTAETALETARRRGAENGDLRRHVTRVEAARELFRKPRRAGPFEVQTVRLGGLRLLAVPLELMASTGRRLAKSYDMIFCYANGYAGYLVSGSSSDYEGLVSPIDPGEVRRFIELVR